MRPGNGRDGKVSRALLVATSNARHTSEDGLQEHSTAIQWTLWGRQLECAAAYLTRGGT